MRIAIVNWSSRKAGGAETYLDRVIGGLRCAGHETALFCETELPADRAPITLPRQTPLWSVSKMGLEAAIDGLTGWHPDVIYAHGLTDPAIEARTLQVAPGSSLPTTITAPVSAAPRLSNFRSSGRAAGASAGNA